MIARAKSRTLLGYCEEHHIIPKCLGGSDESDNLVKLSAREHFVAHLLLHKMHPDNPKLWFAVHSMTRSTQGQCRNNRMYEWMRKTHSLKMKELHTNKTVSDDTRYKMSIAAKKRGNNGWLGRTHLEESRKKMSVAKKMSSQGANNNNAAEWRITDASGSYIIKSLKTFCDDNNLSLYKMRNNKYDNYYVEKL